MKTHYQTLGLQEGASQQEIKEAYERLSKELDPVANNNEDFFVEEYFKVREAYKALSSSSILATEAGARNQGRSKSKQGIKKEVSESDMSDDNHQRKSKIFSIFLIGIIGFVVIFIISFFFETSEIKIPGITYSGGLRIDYYDRSIQELVVFMAFIYSYILFSIHTHRSRFKRRQIIAREILYFLFHAFLLLLVFLFGLMIFSYPLGYCTLCATTNNMIFILCAAYGVRIFMGLIFYVIFVINWAWKTVLNENS